MVLSRVGVTGHTEALEASQNDIVMEHVSLKCTTRGKRHTCLHHRRTCGSSEKGSGKHPEGILIGIGLTLSHTCDRAFTMCLSSVGERVVQVRGAPGMGWGEQAVREGTLPCW